MCMCMYMYYVRIRLTVPLFYSSLPVSHDSVTESQPAHNQHPDPETADWASVILFFILCDVFRQRGQLLASG